MTNTSLGLAASWLQSIPVPPQPTGSETLLRLRWVRGQEDESSSGRSPLPSEPLLHSPSRNRAWWPCLAHSQRADRWVPGALGAPTCSSGLDTSGKPWAQPGLWLPPKDAFWPQS